MKHIARSDKYEVTNEKFVKFMQEERTGIGEQFDASGEESRAGHRCFPRDDAVVRR